MSFSQRFKVSGFTLTELLVTVVLLGLFTAFAGPSFIKFVARERTVSSARSMVNSFSLSRAEAVRLNLAVNVCPLKVDSGNLETNGCNASAGWISADGSTGLNSANFGLNWTSGLLAYADITNTGNDAYSTGKAVHRVLFDPNQVTVIGAVYNASLLGVEHQDNLITTHNLLTFTPEGTYGDGKSAVKFLIKAKSDDSICSVVILEASGRGKLCSEKDTSIRCECSLQNILRP